MIRAMFPPILCQNAMWLQAGGFSGVALFKANPLGWHIAWAVLAVMSYAMAIWMMFDMLNRGLVKL